MLLLPALLLLPLSFPPQGQAPRSGVVEVLPPLPVRIGFPWDNRINGGVGPNVRANQDTGGAPQNETAIAIDPADPLHAVGGANDYRNGDARCGFYTTFDGGDTWVDGTLPLLGTFDASGDSDVAFGPNGDVFYSCLIFQRDSDTPPSGVYVTRSTDGGQTWGSFSPVSVAASNEFDDKEFMEVDRTGGAFNGNIYVSWTKFNSSGSPIFFSRSTDNGATFSTPFQISDNPNNQGSIPIVGPGGEVYVIWEDFNSGVFRLDRSLDGGATFGTDSILPSPVTVTFPLSGFSFRGNSFPYAAVDTSGGPFDGRIYVVWDDARDDAADIFLTFSDDGGASWSSPKRISGPATGSREFFPFVTVDERGRLDVMFYTDRFTSGMLDVAARRSDDGGSSFDPVRRISSVSFDPSLDGFGGGFIGDYNHMAASANAFYPFWTDTRTSGQAADVFISRVELSLELDAVSISNSNPIPVALSLDGGPGVASQEYQVFASCAGTSPGTPVGNVVVPLVKDNCWDKVVKKTNRPPLPNFAGTLDGKGRANPDPMFAPPAGRLGRIVGQTIFFAWVSFDNTGTAVTVSNPCPLDVFP